MLKAYSQTHLVHIGCSTDPGDLGVPLVPSLSLWWDDGAYTTRGCCQDWAQWFRELSKEPLF